MSESQEFTNRHGKKVSVAGTENTSPVHEPAIKPVARPSKPGARTKRSWSLPKIRLPKQVWLGLGGLLLVGLLFGLISADSVKRSYERQTAAMKRSVTDRSKQLFSSEATTETMLKDLRASLKAPSDCHVDGLDIVSWYGPAHAARTACLATAEQYKKLQQSLNELAGISTYLNGLNDALASGLAMPAESGFAAIAEYEKAWSDGLEHLAKLTPPPAVQSSHAAIVAKAKPVRDAWNDLKTANTDQNADNFKAAEKKLGEAYNDFRSAASGVSQIINNEQKTIMTMVKTLSE